MYVHSIKGAPVYYIQYPLGPLLQQINKSKKPKASQTQSQRPKSLQRQKSCAFTKQSTVAHRPTVDSGLHILQAVYNSLCRRWIIFEGVACKLKFRFRH